MNNKLEKNKKNPISENFKNKFEEEKGFSFAEDDNTNFSITVPSYFAQEQKKILHFFQPKSKVLHILDLGACQTFGTYQFKKIDLEIDFIIPRWHRSIILPNGDIYLFGGADAKNTQKKLNNCYIYDPVKLILRGIPNMKIPRSNHSVTFLKEYIYIIGGETIGEKAVADCERINIKSKVWEQLPPMSVATKGAMVCSFQDRFIYKIGGKKDEATLSTVIERLDINKKEWETIKYNISQELSKGGFSLLSLGSCLQINRNCIFVFGGSYPLPYEEKSAQSFILTLIQGEKEAIHRIENYDHFKLPVEDAFWNPQPIVEGETIYCLQNVSHEKQVGAVFLDRKRILKFEPEKGWSVLQ